MPEAVYCAGKTTEQAVSIVTEFLHHETSPVVATRCTCEQLLALAPLSPTTTADSTLTWNHREETGRAVAIVSAGTSDLPVAKEAGATLTALGHQVDYISDVGVAGLDRLTNALPDISVAHLVIAVAGMEGSLPTVLAGLVPQPIIAVPTSVGYGSSLEGVTALLSMLASCAPGLSVVGIDNGYGAACAAHRVLQSRSPR